MEDNNQKINELLNAIPELRQIAETYREISEEDRATIRDTLKQLLQAINNRPLATIPNEEIEKLRRAIKETICSTEMKAPDMIPQAQLFAREVALYLRDNIEIAAAEAMRGKKFPMVVEHVMSHELWRYCEPTVKRWLLILSVLAVISIGGLTTIGFKYFGGWVYWGKRLENVCTDSRQTDEFLKTLENCYDYTRREFMSCDEEKESLKADIRAYEKELSQKPGHKNETRVKLIDKDGLTLRQIRDLIRGN